MNTISLDGKVAVITGASRGLGRAMALAIGGAGAKLALVSRDRSKLEETAAEAAKLGAEAAVFPADVSDESQVRKLEHDVIKHFGRADILINNAGIAIRKTVVEYTLEEWNAVMDTNLTSVFLMCRSFVPHMVGKGYGRVINISSIMGHVSIPLRSAYSASKFGVLGLTKALALEHATDGIAVVAISPGPFATEMTAPLRQQPDQLSTFNSSVPMARWGEPEEVGKLALFLCSDGAGYITGTDIVIDGGWTAR
jgi:NAD(P)-dependent dehydrogenase (short-subunit alcohol dehydrogenase family)